MYELVHVLWMIYVSTFECTHEFIFVCMAAVFRFACHPGVYPIALGQEGKMKNSGSRGSNPHPGEPGRGIDGFAGGYICTIKPESIASAVQLYCTPLVVRIRGDRVAREESWMGGEIMAFKCASGERYPIHALA